MQHDQSATAGAGTAGSVVGASGGPPSLPHLARRMPDDAPLLLRPRVGRLLAFFGPLQLGVPAVVLVVFAAWMTVQWDRPASEMISVMVGFPLLIVAFCGGLPLLVFVVLAVGGGPQLAASEHGVWVQAHGWWTTRNIYLPWDAVDRISARRHRRVLWRLVCLRVRVSPPGSELQVQLDVRLPRTASGKTFTASPFLCGRRVDVVLDELSGLSGGRVPVG